MGESTKALINDAGSALRALQVSVPVQGRALSEVPGGGAYLIAKPRMVTYGGCERGVEEVDGDFYKSTRDDRFVQACPPVNRWIVVSFEPAASYVGGGKGGGKGGGGKGGGKGGGGKGGGGKGGGGGANGPEEVIRGVANKLRQGANSKGIELAELVNRDGSRDGGDVYFLDGMLSGPQQQNAIEAQLDRIMRECESSPRGAPKFVLAIISNNKDMNGKTVKPALDRWSILHAPYLPVICMQVDKAKDKGTWDMTFAKLNLAKLNARLGGINTYAKGMLTEATPTMVVGLDVFHSSAGSSMRSISAYVASMDDQCTSYHTALREHEKLGDEKLTDIEEVVEKQLMAYYRKHSRFPHRLVVYRDGIAHSAFAAIGRPEIEGIKRVFEKLRISPALVFLVVQKRNLTRLFQRRVDRDGVEFYTNVPPGTAVDVVRDANFWLVAHSALQGTTRVPSYHILCNEPNADVGASAPALLMEEIVQLTYDLCHGHFKCNRSVSVPSPVYFADLAAERATSLYECDEHGAQGRFLGGNFDETQSLRLFF